MKKVIFVGAGEYAESVYDSMAKEEYDLIGFVDEYKKGYHMGKPILAATIEEVFNFRDYAYFTQDCGGNVDRYSQRFL